MSITVNIYYTGENGAARKFAEEMTASGTVALIRQEPGNLKYNYFFPADDPETVLLIDSWEKRAAVRHHHLDMRITGEHVARNHVHDGSRGFGEVLIHGERRRANVSRPQECG